MSALPGGLRPISDPPAYVFVDAAEIARLRALADTLAAASRAVSGALAHGSLTTASFESAKAGCARAVSAAWTLNADLWARPENPST